MAAAATVRTDLHGVHYCDPTNGHRLRPYGGLLPHGSHGLDCHQPLRVVCRDCDFTTAWACGGHRESRCRPCATRYRRRVRAVAESGLARGGGYFYFLTMTAPGESAHRVGRTGRLCPCTPVGGVDLAAWNTSHSRRWNHFRTRLRQEVPTLQFFRGVEVQDRGALHDHAMVWSPVSLSKSWLRQLAMTAGFGHSLDLEQVQPGSKKAAYYVAKYVTKGADLRADVPWLGERVDLKTGEVTFGLVDGRYRTWSMSQYWGMKMAHARAKAAEYARLKQRELERLAHETALAAVAGIAASIDQPAEAANDP